MKKRTLIIAVLLLTGLTFSCEDSFNEISKEQVIEVKSDHDGDDVEDVAPGERKKVSNS